MIETPTMNPVLEAPAWQEVAPELEVLASLDLPGSDGRPMDNERERLQMTLGLDSLGHYWRDRKDFYTGGNMFIYYSLAQAYAVLEEEQLEIPFLLQQRVPKPDPSKRAFRGPDMFVVLNVDNSYRRQKWVVWEEDGRYPNVIFEFLSPRTRHIDLGEKKRLYEQTFKTKEYFCFDYLKPTGARSLLGWRLDDHDCYQPIMPDARGWLWSEKLQLWVGRWTGEYLRDKTVWMRFYTLEGNLVLTAAEYEYQRAEQERQHAERLAEQLRAMGIEPEA